MNKVALGIFAHPDDAEFMCAGTLSLLNRAGWTIHIAAITKNDTSFEKRIHRTDLYVSCV